MNICQTEFSVGGDHSKKAIYRFLVGEILDLSEM